MQLRLVTNGLRSGRCCSGVQLLIEAQTGSGASFQPGWMGTVGAEKEPSIHRAQGVLHQNKTAFARQPAMVTGRDGRNSVYFRWCLNANKGIPENLFPAKERKRPQLFSSAEEDLRSQTTVILSYMSRKFSKYLKKFQSKFAQVGRRDEAWKRHFKRKGSERLHSISLSIRLMSLWEEMDLVKVHDVTVEGVGFGWMAQRRKQEKSSFFSWED